MKYFLSLALVLGYAASSFAGFSLSWSPVSGSSTGGSPIAVNLLLNETGTTDMTTWGLAGANVKVTRSGVGALTTPIGNVGLGFFDVADTTGSTASVGNLAQTSLDGAGIGSLGSLVLGTFTINPTIDGSGTLSVASLLGNNDDLRVYTDGVGGSLDLAPGAFTGAPEFTFNFTAVPEPGSIVGASVLGMVGYLRWRQKRKVRGTPAIS